MLPLFAETESVVESSGMFPSYFGVMLLAMAIVFALALVLYTLGWRVIDWITPGKLDEEIVPKDPAKKPNLALAMVVSAMLVGLAIVLGCTIIGVMVH